MQLAGLAQGIDIAPDGLRGHPEMLGQKLDRNKALFLDQIQNLIVSATNQGGLSIGGLGRDGLLAWNGWDDSFR
jgi:hypothetical protein